MIDLKHELGAERLVTAQEITETLCGVNLCHIVNNVLLKLQEIDLALRQIPELRDTHLTSIRELMVQMYNDEHACLTAVQKPQTFGRVELHVDDKVLSFEDNVREFDVRNSTTVKESSQDIINADDYVWVNPELNNL